MVAQRKRDLTFQPAYKPRKPTKKAQRAAQDLANKQKAWDNTYGKTITPTHVNESNGFQFDTTDYERQLGNAFKTPRVNYLAMSESDILARQNSIGGYCDIRGHKLDKDDETLIKLALDIVRFEQVIVGIDDARLTAQLTAMKRAYVESTLQDKIDESFRDRNNDEVDILSDWLSHERDYLYDDDKAIVCTIPVEHYTTIKETLDTIRKDVASVKADDHDLNALRTTVRKMYKADTSGHVLQENLLAGLKAVRPAIASKPQLAVLGNVYISNQDEPGYLTLEASNLELTISAKVRCAEHMPYVNTTVPANILTEYIALEDTDKPIRLLQWDFHRLSIMQDNHHATLQGIQTSEFPHAPAMPAHFATIHDVKQFKAHCKTLAASTSKEDNRPILHGVNVDFRNDGAFYMCAVDGHKVVERTIPVISILDTFGSFIVPGNTLATLAKIIPDDTSAITVARDDKHVWFAYGNVVVCSVLIEGKFPAYQSIVPKSCDTTGKVDLDALQKAIKTYKGHEQVTISVSDDGCASEFNTAFTMYHDGTEAILDARVEGKPFKAEFNVKRLTSIVNETVKANPRGTVPSMTKTGKTTRVKDKSPRYVEFKWNQGSHLLVLTYNGMQNTLIAIVPVDTRPAWKFDPRDNDYWWQDDHNTYTQDTVVYEPESYTRTTKNYVSGMLYLLHNTIDELITTHHERELAYIVDCHTSDETAHKTVVQASHENGFTIRSIGIDAYTMRWFWYNLEQWQSEDYWPSCDHNDYTAEAKRYTEPAIPVVYTYCMMNRPAGYGTCPERRLVDDDKPQLPTEQQDHYGTVSYTRQLSQDELYRYEMAPYSDNAYLYPIGARVLVNEQDEAVVSAHLPRGRYEVKYDCNGQTENVHVKAIVPIPAEPAIPPDPTGWYRRSLQQARAEMEREAKRLAEYDAQVKLYRAAIPQAESFWSEFYTVLAEYVSTYLQNGKHFQTEHKPIPPDFQRTSTKYSTQRLESALAAAVMCNRRDAIPAYVFESNGYRVKMQLPKRIPPSYYKVDGQWIDKYVQMIR